MFTPKELQEKTFDKAVFGGYDMQMVDEFLEPLTEDYITLYKENSVLKSKMKILVEKLEEYREQELSMKKALVAAQQTSDSIIAEAQKKAAVILNDAETSAHNKAENLKHEFAEEQQRIDHAKAAAQSFIAAIEAEVQQHLDLLARVRKLTASASAEPVMPVIEPVSVPLSEPAASEMDLAAEIGSAVQEIAGEGEKKGNFRFEDLQFGKDYVFAE